VGLILALRLVSAIYTRISPENGRWRRTPIYRQYCAEYVRSWIGSTEHAYFVLEPPSSTHTSPGTRRRWRVQFRALRAKSEENTVKTPILAGRRSRPPRDKIAGPFASGQWGPIGDRNRPRRPSCAPGAGVSKNKFMENYPY